jgi:hypothetical protein
LECELLDRTRFATRTQARTAVFDYLERFYNPQRRHSTLGYLSPADYEGATNPPVRFNPALTHPPNRGQLRGVTRGRSPAVYAPLPCRFLPPLESRGDLLGNDIQQIKVIVEQMLEHDALHSRLS